MKEEQLLNKAELVFITDLLKKNKMGIPLGNETLQKKLGYLLSEFRMEENPEQYSDLRFSDFEKSFDKPPMKSKFDALVKIDGKPTKKEMELTEDLVTINMLGFLHDKTPKEKALEILDIVKKVIGKIYDTKKF